MASNGAPRIDASPKANSITASIGSTGLASPARSAGSGSPTAPATVGYQVREKTPKTEAGEDRIVYLDDGTLAALEHKLHGMHHFRASALISTGADIAAVSKQLGHSTISVTSDLYGHLFEKASKEMAAKAANLVPRATTSGTPATKRQLRRLAA